MNAINFFNLWFNIVFYGVCAVIATEVPFPEYLILPVVTLGFTVYIFITFLQMSNVRTSWNKYHRASRQLKLSIVMEKFITSVRPLGIQLGRFTFVTRLAPLMFLAVTIDYMITTILAMA